MHAEDDATALLDHLSQVTGRPAEKGQCSIAELEQKIADTELNSALIEMKQGSGGPVLTPKDEMNVRIQERQKYLDLLDARLQLAKAEISLSSNRPA